MGVISPHTQKSQEIQWAFKEQLDAYKLNKQHLVEELNNSIDKKFNAPYTTNISEWL